MKIAIIGATGYTGFELIKILLNHKNCEIIFITSDTSFGKKITDFYPSLIGRIDLELTNNNFEYIAKYVDAVFLCLPHSASQEAAAFFYNKGKIVIDLSADFRISDKKLYEETYQVEHKYPKLLKEAIYGLPEIFSNKIKNTKLIANPGCYTTSVILPLYPLLKDNLIQTENIIADSKSGVSGAGKKPSEKTHFCETNEDFKPYGILSHRHNPEINHILQKTTKTNDLNVIFTPHLLPINRGIESTIYAKTDVELNILYDSIKKYYEKMPFVRIYENGKIPSIKNVAYTNFIDIALFKKSNQLVIVSCIDNLIKGASGQAVQNFNIICGFEETTALI